MAVETDVTLTDTSVNSGTAVALNALHVKWAFTNYLKSPQGPGKPSTLTRNQRLAQNIHLGFDNPDLIVDLQWNVDSSASNTITFALLKSFCESTNAKTLTTDEFGTITVDLMNAVCDTDYGSTSGKQVKCVITFKEAQV